MNSTENDHSLFLNKEQIFQKFNELKSNENLITAAQKAYAIFIQIETLLKQYPVRISLMTIIGSTLLFAYFQNEFTRSLAIASFVIIFAAMTYRLGQANYHKNVFEDRFEVAPTSRTPH